MTGRRSALRSGPSSTGGGSVSPNLARSAGDGLKLFLLLFLAEEEDSLVMGVVKSEQNFSGFAMSTSPPCKELAASEGLMGVAQSVGSDSLLVEVDDNDDDDWDVAKLMSSSREEKLEVDDDDGDNSSVNGSRSSSLPLPSPNKFPIFFLKYATD